MWLILEVWQYTQFCHALFGCAYIIGLNRFLWCIYHIFSGLLHWHSGNHMIALGQWGNHKGLQENTVSNLNKMQEKCMYTFLGRYCTSFCCPVDTFVTVTRFFNYPPNQMCIYTFSVELFWINKNHCVSAKDIISLMTHWSYIVVHRPSEIYHHVLF